MLTTPISRKERQRLY